MNFMERFENIYQNSDPYFNLSNGGLYLEIPIMVDEYVFLICRDANNKFFIAVPSNYCNTNKYNHKTFYNNYFIFCITKKSLFNFLNETNTIIDILKSDSSSFKSGWEYMLSTKHNLKTNVWEDKSKPIGESFFNDVFNKDICNKHKNKIYYTSLLEEYKNYLFESLSEVTNYEKE